jgi:acetyl-CoA carboxylase biotin carboxyl carrier protein
MWNLRFHHTQDAQRLTMPASKKAKTPPAKANTRSPELTLIDNLAEILNSTGLTEIEMEQKGVRVRVSKAVTASFQAAPQNYAPPTPAPSSAPIAVAAATPVADHAGSVKSPMVGTVYMAASPEAAPFITIGATVRQGQTLLIIEAMKTMNQIPAPKSGKVTQIMVDNGSPVEFGEVLLVIE